MLQLRGQEPNKTWPQIMDKKYPILDRKKARELDQRAIEVLGIPSILLMESAGRGIAEFILSRSIQGKIVICCGKGNNAGDGFVVSRYLNHHHIPAHILLFANPSTLKGDAKINYNIALKTGLPITVVTEESTHPTLLPTLTEQDWIIDAIFGTGLQGEVNTFYSQVIQAMNESRASMIAIDIPSGLDCDTGEPLGVAVKAVYTLTIACYKKGFTAPRATEYLGKVHVIDIGISKLLEYP